MVFMDISSNGVTCKENITSCYRYISPARKCGYTAHVISNVK